MHLWKPNLRKSYLCFIRLETVIAGDSLVSYSHAQLRAIKFH